MASVAPKYAWMNGKVIPWEQCVLHGRSAGGFMAATCSRGCAPTGTPSRATSSSSSMTSTSSDSGAR